MNRFKIFFLLALWLVLISHDCIPHHHPNGDSSLTEFLNLQNASANQGQTSQESPESDENGILDNLEVIHTKIDISCKAEVKRTFSNLILPKFHKLLKIFSPIHLWVGEFIIIELPEHKACQIIKLRRGPPVITLFT